MIDVLVEVEPITLRGLARRYAALPLAERSLLSDGATGKRRAEFVAGRETARRVIARWLGSTRHDIVIARDPGPGGPRVVVSPGVDPAPQVSISHAGRWCAAACGPRPVGIDLVVEEPQPSSFVAEAFAPGELDEWSSWLELPRKHPRTIATAFAAKEAVLKIRRTGFGEPLHGVVVRPAPPPRSTSLGFTIEVNRTDRFIATVRWRAGMVVFVATIPVEHRD